MEPGSGSTGKLQLALKKMAIPENTVHLRPRAKPIHVPICKPLSPSLPPGACQGEGHNDRKGWI
jgi:hypothetical protein